MMAVGSFFLSGAFARTGCQQALLGEERRPQSRQQWGLEGLQTPAGSPARQWLNGKCTPVRRNRLNVSERPSKSSLIFTVLRKQRLAKGLGESSKGMKALERVGNGHWASLFPPPLVAGGALLMLGGAGG